MDWIFVRGEMKAIDAEVITDSMDGRFPSDHYFVGATISVEETRNHGKPKDGQLSSEAAPGASSEEVSS